MISANREAVTASGSHIARWAMALSAYSSVRENNRLNPLKMAGKRRRPFHFTDPWQPMHRPAPPATQRKCDGYADRWYLSPMIDPVFLLWREEHETASWNSVGADPAHDRDILSRFSAPHTSIVISNRYAERGCIDFTDRWGPRTM